jgi:hypothetical protein
MVYGDGAPDVRSGRSKCLITAAPCAPEPPIIRIIFFVEVDLNDFKSRKSKYATVNFFTYIFSFCLYERCISLLFFIYVNTFCASS